jgi:hypothetical protein
VYVHTEDGVQAAIPPNTVFYIGLPHAQGLTHFAPPAADPRLAPPPTTEPQLTEPMESHVYDMDPGLPPGARAGEQTRDVRSRRTNREFVTEPDRVEQATAGVPRHDSDAGPAIVADRDYRASRVQRLLQRAQESRAQRADSE